MSWDAVLEAAPRVFGEPEFDFSDGPFSADEASTVAELESVQRDKAALCADEVRLLARYNQLRGGVENVSEEIGQALKWAPGHASHQVVMAEALVTRLPQTLSALGRGVIDWAKARAMYEVTRPLSDEDAARVEAAVLVDAPVYYTRFQRKVRYWVNKVDPDGAEQRRLARRKDRCVTFTQDEDGEAFLGIRGPVEQLYPAYVRIDQHARRLKQQGDARSLDTIVWVTVPHTTLLGVDDKPGELFGVDILPAQVVRELAADQKSTWDEYSTTHRPG
ncbi:uncharacterized protein DUF222 [Herbihabitans rhizosphaerae]|uniref:Uncharacterized protein DUF222 n=1 Tax=Herbihabitans rhizosphaerae TaxID=1872711 RepID=A0A4Q7L2P9_9PSEU|nr:DUF222 domain-containing protein [Herbihabitans rhizosphaerae]RZS43495.1 uncharacterized protein DUF222 [Herbihabitans rhizosphaerae]